VSHSRTRPLAIAVATPKDPLLEVPAGAHCVFKARRSTAPLECPDAAASPSGAFVFETDGPSGGTHTAPIDGAEDPSGPDTVTLPGSSKLL